MDKRSGSLGCTIWQRVMHCKSSSAGGDLFRANWVCCAALMLYGCSQGFAADDLTGDQGTRSVRFRVQIANSLMRDAAKIANTEFVVAQNVFVYVPPLNLVRGEIAAREWLQKQVGAPPTQKQHRFKLQDGRLIPSALVARVGDKIWRLASNGQELNLHSPQQNQIGPSAAAIPEISLRSPDFSPCELSLMDHTPAYLLVSDHGVARITDDAGLAEFKRLPKQLDLPYRVCCPWISGRVDYRSETLKILPGGRFVLKADSEVLEHTIRILPLLQKTRD